MRHQLRKLAVIGAVLLGGLFLMFVFNQTMQLVAAAEGVSPLFGAVVLWAIIGVYTFGILIFLWNFLRLPRPLRPPRSEDSPQFDAFLRRLRNRLRSNPELAERRLESREDIDDALAALGEKADGMTREAALQAFFVTAISQNGNLDAFAVMAIHARLVYDVARLYYQRPSARDLLYLYWNVVIAAIVARQLDDWDLTEYVTPIINASMGSAIGAVPGATAAANAGVHAVLTGSANAYMTLRIGVIAKRFCASVTLPDRDRLRDRALVEAVKMFPGVVGDGTKKVFQIVGDAAKTGTKRAVTALGTGVKDVATGVGTGVKGAARSVSDAARGLFSREAAEEAAAGTDADE